MIYAFSGPRWNSSQITWSFALSTSPQDQGSPFSGTIGFAHQQVFQAAFATWEGVSGLDFLQVADQSGADIRLGWGTFGTSSGQIGEARWRTVGSPPTFDPGVIIRIEDPAERPLAVVPGTGDFAYNPSTRLSSVVLHEIGHAIGLDHNGDGTSLMSATAGATNRQLSFSDKFSVQLLYGDHDQHFRATGGRDIFYGFAGNDSVTFGGNIAEYTVSLSGGGYAVSRNTDAADRDIVFGVESLQFADTRIAVGKAAGLFDPVAYALAYGDVVAAGLDPRFHFDSGGWREGRASGTEYNAYGYSGANPDVHAAGINPLTHYEATGWREGRDPVATFDVRLYLIRNPDVAQAGVEPFSHYLQSGRAEGRVASPTIGDRISGGFDEQYYMLSSPDVARAGMDALQHWQQYGRFEGRAPDAWFDTRGYLAAYADVAEAGADPLAHYANYGWWEGRDPSAAFDSRKYLAAYQDVAASGRSPLDHFLTSGAHEGRSAFGDGMFA